VTAHGFTGDPSDFDGLLEPLGERITRLDMELPGHIPAGSEPAVRTWESWLAKLGHQLNKRKRLDEPVYLLGYSMGARLLLRAQLEQRWKIRGALFLGLHPGIESEAERSMRLQTDKAWSDLLLKQGTRAFMEAWMNQPLIRSQKGRLDAGRLNQKTALDAPSLADALLRFSHGSLPPVWHALEQWTIPTLLVTGSLDNRYQELHKRIHNLNSVFRPVILPACGHAPHLELPPAVLASQLAISKCFIRF